MVACCAVAAWAQDLPSCRVISGRAGGPAILINGETLSPIFFAGNNQFNRDEILIEEVRQTGDAGIALISFNLPLDWGEASFPVAETLDAFCGANPDAYFYLRIWVGGTPAWLAEHPEARIVNATGEPVPWSSPASQVWRAEADRLLRARLDEVVNGPHRQRFIGVCVTNMQTGEWFYRHANDFLDYSEANRNAFGRWLKDEYLTNRRLQKAWGNPSVTFETAELPRPELTEAAIFGPFRDPVGQRSAMDAQRFQSELVVDTIAHFARLIKEATNGRALAGAFYGYTLELNHNGPRVLAQSGHLALGRLLDCPDIDLIHAPYSYFQRKLGQPGHFHLPVDSVALHGKLAVLEEDTFTHLAIEPPEGVIAPGGPDRTKTLEETLAVNRRNYANFFTHNCGFWYFDLLSDGRWRGKKVWETAPLLRRMAATMRDQPVFEPEVAFVVDEDSVHTLLANTHPYLIQSLAYWRAEMARLGTTVGFYLQSDVARIPDSVKVFVMANPYVLTGEEERALARVLGRGSTVVWTFAPGLCSSDGLDVACVEEVTGIDVAPTRAQGPFTIVSNVTKESVPFDMDWQPRFAVQSTDVHVIATYKESGDVAAAARPFKGGVSVYTAVPRLPVETLKWICRNSGVHFYRESPGMAGVVGPYLIVHTDNATTERFHWPREFKAVERLIPYSEFPLATETYTWTDALPAKSTVIYRCTR